MSIMFKIMNGVNALLVLTFSFSCVTSRTEVKKEPVPGKECPHELSTALGNLVQTYSKVPTEILNQKQHDEVIAGLKKSVVDCNNLVNNFRSADGCTDQKGNVLNIKTLEGVCQNWNNRIVEIERVWNK